MKVHMRQVLLQLITPMGDGFSKVNDEALNIWLKGKTPFFHRLMATKNHLKEVSFLMPLDCEKLLQERPEYNIELPSSYASHRDAEMRIS